MMINADESLIMQHSDIFTKSASNTPEQNEKCFDLANLSIELQNQHDIDAKYFWDNQFRNIIANDILELYFPTDSTAVGPEDYQSKVSDKLIVRIGLFWLNIDGLTRLDIDNDGDDEMDFTVNIINPCNDR